MRKWKPPPYTLNMATTNEMITNARVAASLAAEWLALWTLLRIASILGFCYVFYSIIYAIYCYFRDNGYEAIAAKLIQDFRNYGSDWREEAVALAINVDNGGSSEPAPRPHIRGWQRVTQNKLQDLAFSLADEAFFQYGRRKKSQANDLVTRKFMRDYLSKYDTLRAKDKSLIIEIALPLSYVVPSETEVMDQVVRTRTYGEATGHDSTLA